MGVADNQRSNQSNQRKFAIAVDGKRPSTEVGPKAWATGCSHSGSRSRRFWRSSDGVSANSMEHGGGA